MKKLGLALILALSSSAAYAGSSYEFRIHGGVARIYLGGHCRHWRCVSWNWSDRDRSSGRKSARTSRTAPPTRTAEEEPPAPVWNTLPATATAEPATPAYTQTYTPTYIPAVETPAPQPVFVPAPVDLPPVPEPPAPTPPVVAPVLASTKQQVATLAPAPAIKAAATGPVGEWLVEDGVGRIRIEECGKHLCGTVTAAKNPNDTDRKNPDSALRKRTVVGVQVLIDMKPGKANRWDGEIYNVETGGTYTAHMQLKSANTLRVEGCTFAGLFCGGQTWTRVN